MGDQVYPRREWIEQNVQFGLQEEDTILSNDNVDVYQEQNEKLEGDLDE